MFKNRAEAGVMLGKELECYQKREPIVVAVSSGGVEVGYHIANQLQCELEMVIARKLSYSHYPEISFGALAEDGSLYLNPESQGRISREEILRTIKLVKNEIERRIKICRNGKPIVSMKGRTIILVDDGISSGSSIFAAIELCKKRQAEKIVVASPVCAPHLLKFLINRVDDLVILTFPEPFYSVSQAYEEFPDPDDQKVSAYLQKHQTPVSLIESLR